LRGPGKRFQKLTVVGAEDGLKIGEFDLQKIDIA
jgi:hypothetical protein